MKKLIELLTKIFGDGEEDTPPENTNDNGSPGHQRPFQIIF